MSEQIGYQGFCSGILNARIPSDVYIDMDDFRDIPNSWAFTQATAGEYSLDADEENGVLLLDSGSTTEAQGLQGQKILAAFKPEVGRTIWFETRVKVTGISNLNAELFIGLAAIDDTVIAASAVSTSNHIGFSSVTDNGILLSNSAKAGSGSTGLGFTVASDTWVKLAIKVTDLTTASFFVNGVFVNAIPTAYIPIVVLTPTFVCQSGGTDQPILHIDYWIGQQTR